MKTFSGSISDRTDKYAASEEIKNQIDRLIDEHLTTEVNGEINTNLTIDTELRKLNSSDGTTTLYPQQRSLRERQVHFQMILFLICSGHLMISERRKNGKSGVLVQALSSLPTDTLLPITTSSKKLMK